jgi:hypothetical protein
MEYPLWLEIVLALSVSVALMGLGGWMLFSFATRAITAAVNLEDRRAKKETDALENWQTLYEEEHAQRIKDTADLINKVQELQCEIKRMKERMAKVKVKDL